MVSGRSAASAHSIAVALGKRMGMTEERATQYAEEIFTATPAASPSPPPAPPPPAPDESYLVVSGRAAASVQDIAIALGKRMGMSDEQAAQYAEALTKASPALAPLFAPVRQQPCRATHVASADHTLRTKLQDRI